MEIFNFQGFNSHKSIEQIREELPSYIPMKHRQKKIKFYNGEEEHIFVIQRPEKEQTEPLDLGSEKY
jgi:hypothetical protein